MTIISKNSEAPRNSLGLYLHIPFCIRKCNYCDFLSFGNVPDEQQNSYFTALTREIEEMGKVYRNIYYVDTIFIGGGTPSLVRESLIEGMMAAVRGSFRVAEDAEISIESNPKTLTEQKLKTYLAAGINRLSIGAQSMNDRLLEYMGRVHTDGDFLRNYVLARECGFGNINIDLIFGIPGQTLDVWMETLNGALKLKPEHISFYSLQIEEGTPFFDMHRSGRLKPVDEETDRSMYHKAVEGLEKNGYLHYEISNAAIKGYHCRHNLKYWSMGDYLGLGLGAHSFVKGIRFSNVTDLSRYIQVGMQNNGCGNKKSDHDGTDSPFLEWCHINSNEENISEYMFTGLRRLAGIDMNDFEIRFGRRMEDVFSTNWRRIKKYIDEGYLIELNGTLRLSIKGIDISNAILREFV